MGFTPKESMVCHTCCHVVLAFQSLIVTEAVLTLNVIDSPDKMPLFHTILRFDFMMMPTSLSDYASFPVLCTHGIQV